VAADNTRTWFVERTRFVRSTQHGIGLSDPASGVTRLEQRVWDLRAVLDAVGSERATLLGYCNGGPASILFAATFCESAGTGRSSPTASGSTTS
jgi:pimeloyl-ACP methyl ester carboxylesterase